MAQVKTDKYGIEYFEGLPETARLADINDFEMHGKWFYGKYYLVQGSVDQNIYFLRKLNTHTCIHDLLQHIGAGQVFVANTEINNKS